MATLRNYRQVSVFFSTRRTVELRSSYVAVQATCQYNESGEVWAVTIILKVPHLVSNPMPTTRRVANGESSSLVTFNLPPSRRTSRGRFSPLVRLGIIFFVAIPASVLLGAPPVSYFETELLFHQGRYEACSEVAAQQVQRGVWNELWPELLIRCQLTLGQYEGAQQTYEQNLKRFGERIAYRLLGHQVYRTLGDSDTAAAQLDKILQLVQASPWRYSSMRDRVNLGRYFRLQDEDARQILELIYDPVRKRNADYAEVYLATSELALEKHDYQLAAEQLEIACRLQPRNPQAFYLNARALQNSDPQRAGASLAKAIELNPRHVPSLLLQVDQAIDRESYSEAETKLQAVMAINLRQPEAWAYHATIAHLSGHYQGERALRSAAFSTAPLNYRIDHLIGRKLSQKYRFREGAKYQRDCLEQAPNDLAAKFQLANDLLRLGETDEGWPLALEVQQRDGYHVEAFNLANLKDRLDQYHTIETDHFVVRMTADEATIYGHAVVQLLEEAYDTLVPKYQAELAQKTQVEIFDRQQDFAIRTFGLPGGAGYLGVCFGPLITVNSPVAQGESPTNWQSILWHEFCHVVTLCKTNNRMPRWLSEGISVYEERLRNPGWGQRMTPSFRSMTLSNDLTPVSQLSGAFLRPKSPAHLDFAYFEASMVIEYLVHSVGIETLIQVLDDLAVGIPINQALARRMGQDHDLDRDFAEFAIGQANSFGDQFDWDRAMLRDDSDATTRATLLKQFPNNFWLISQVSRDRIQSGAWQQARDILESAYQSDPVATEPLLPSLARVYRELNLSEKESDVLNHLAALDADAIPAYRRLLESGQDREDWDTVATNAERIIAVNPMLQFAQQAFVDASEQLGRFQDVARAQRALLRMNPADPAAANFRLAEALMKNGDDTLAKRHVLRALEEAPRYRDAHRLLLSIVDSHGKESE